MAVVVCGAIACVPQSANAQGLWVGGWGWGGPMAVGGFGPGFGPGFAPGFGPGVYGFGPRYVSTFSSVGWGYPAYRAPYYGPAFYGPSFYRPAYYGPAYYGPVYRPAPLYVGPSAHAIRVGNRVARRSWRRGWGW